MFYSENRYLLFLTENYAALDILRHYLQGALSFTLSDGSSDGDTEPFILFGSSFPRDKEYTQVGITSGELRYNDDKELYVRVMYNMWLM